VSGVPSVSGVPGVSEKPTPLAGGRRPGLLARGPWATDAVQARWRERDYDPDPGAAAAADAAIDRLRERGSPTHDGTSGRLAGFEQNGGRLAVELEPARWALRLGPDAHDSMSALCAVRDADGRWLAGRRAAWVASWPGRWALGAGGAVDVGESPALTLSRELMEEWSVAPQRLTAEALVRLPTGLVMLVGLAHLAAGVETELVREHEHDAHAWWPPDPADWPAEAEQPLRRMATLLGG
jgi:8-oxo-dGTP pyrophosphatase MutT (NUDIX family)